MNVTATPFLAQLLAPLPDGEEAVDTKAFRREIQNDVINSWQWGEKEIAFAWATVIRDLRGLDVARTAFARETMKTMASTSDILHEKKIREQLLRPAPSKAALNWKMRQRRCRDDASVIAAIERDKARLGVFGAKAREAGNA